MSIRDDFEETPAAGEQPHGRDEAVGGHSLVAVTGQIVAGRRYRTGRQTLPSWHGGVGDGPLEGYDRVYVSSGGNRIELLEPMSTDG